MAMWWVSEPWLNLRLEDEPLGYNPARGPRVNFHISYRQNQSVAEYPTIFSTGPAWTCSFRAYVYPDPNNGMYYLHRFGAAWLEYTAGSTQTRDGSLLSVISADNVKIEHVDGSVDIYSTPFTNSAGDVFLFLTSKSDPAGNGNTYTYSTNAGIFRLDTVTDADGHVTHLYYENGSFPNQITRVVDPYLRTSLLTYDDLGYLTNSVDVQSLSSAFRYSDGSERGWITNLVTSYGTNTFRYGSISGSGIDPYVEVTNRRQASLRLSRIL